MKRLLWGAVLFLFAFAGSDYRVQACDKRALITSAPMSTRVFEQDENTLLVISDEDSVTVVAYESPRQQHDWL
jgi:hypothetical protein